MSRPWSVWWDFKYAQGKLWGVVVESDHKKYGGELLAVPLSKVVNKDGSVGDWVDGFFKTLQEDLYSGRVSISKLDRKSETQEGKHR